MKTKVLAISSSGGHWEQLMKIAPAFDDCEVLYANTLKGLAERNKIENFKIVNDCSRSNIAGNFKTFAQIVQIMNGFRPDVVITTGAAPGLIALFVGRAQGCRTIWIDSIANSERLSLSGKLARLFCDIHVTQWPHLADGKRTFYAGSVL